MIRRTNPERVSDTAMTSASLADHAPASREARDLLRAQGHTTFFRGLAEAAAEVPAPYLPQLDPPGPFYEGEKRKGMTRAKRQALAQNLADLNVGARPNRVLTLEGPVQAAKISVAEGAQQSYVVTGRMSKGAFGKFRGAVCLETGMALGLKELRSSRAPLPKPGKHANTRVSSDARICDELALQGIASPGLQVHDVLEYNGKVYVFMPWMTGDALSFAKADMTQAERAAAGRGLFYDVLCDLKRCHNAGYIHHDVKLENILWHSERGTFCLSDYGLARPIATSRGRPGGTAGLYAPEILQRDVYGANSDLWSAGLTYFDLLLYDKRSPLFWSGSAPSDKQRGIAINESFFAWREGMFNALGEIEAWRIHASRTPFGLYFSEGLHRDPYMTLSVLRYALARRAERVSSAYFVTRLEFDQVLDAATQNLSHQAMRRVAGEDRDAHNARGVLHAARGAHLQSLAGASHG